MNKCFFLGWFFLFPVSVFASPQETWSYDGQVIADGVPEPSQEVDDYAAENSRWYVNEQGQRVLVRWGQGELPNLEDYRQSFDALDTNGDGRLVREELPPNHALLYEWRLVDANADGVITRAEFGHWR